MIEQLFGSKTRVKLLKMFYSNPNRPFYVREITRKIDEQINSVRRELGNLLSIGIIASDDAKNKLYYEVNQSYEYYKPLQEIFGEGEAAASDGDAKAVAPSPEAVVAKKAKADPVLAELLTVGNVEFALYTGQFTRDEASGIDMLIVGDVNSTKMQKFITALEEKEKKEIRYVVMTPSEFSYRQEVKDRFISSVMASKKQIIIDKRPATKEEE
jgi:predicted transcriptional regulator